LPFVRYPRCAPVIPNPFSGISSNHPRDTRFLMHENCAEKRRRVALETVLAKNPLQLRHLINDFDVARQRSFVFQVDATEAGKGTETALWHCYLAA
jgi:hypothetical protein